MIGESNLVNYIGFEEKEYIKDCLNDNQLVSVYYFIDSYGYISNMNEPPFISYELIILVRNKEKYFTQAFTKKKYPNEFSTLNNLESYNKLFPLEFAKHELMIEYPLIENCKKVGLYNILEAKEIEKEINKLSLPLEITKNIASFVIKDTYNLENEEFYLSNQYYSTSKLVCEYYNYFSKKVYVLIKNKD